MIDNKKILALIPARGTSRGVPRKNIKELLGKPLVAYSIEEAKKSKYIDRIVTITDDKEIANIAKKYGAEVPFMEPEEFAKEEADIVYLRYAIEKLEEDKNYKPELIVFLRPTCPLRRVEHINAGIEKIVETGADCIKSVCRVPCHPHKMWEIKGDKLAPFQKTKLWVEKGTDVPRQTLSEVYFSNSGVDIFRRKNLYKFNYLFGDGLDIRTIVMADKESIDIDEPIDFLIAETILKERENSKD
jgi:CMP-N-acetylneuraminic acid synthetase